MATLNEVSLFNQLPGLPIASVCEKYAVHVYCLVIWYNTRPFVDRLYSLASIKKIQYIGYDQKNYQRKNPFVDRQAQSLQFAMTQTSTKMRGLL